MTEPQQQENIYDGAHYVISYNDVMRIRGYMIRARISEEKCNEFEGVLCRNIVPCSRPVTKEESNERDSNHKQ